MTFIPLWAASQFAPKPSETEAVLLREFYEAWEAMHATNGNKDKVSQAADRLINAANMVRRYREPVVV